MGFDTVVSLLQKQLLVRQDGFGMRAGRQVKQRSSDQQNTGTEIAKLNLATTSC